MTVSTEIHIVDGTLMVKGKPILTHVPKNVVLTASNGTMSQGAFLGSSSLEKSNRHVFPLGVLRGLRFMCCFRFSLWWMTHRMGVSGKDVPLETQFLLLESQNEPQPNTDAELDSVHQTVYTVLLPLLDGAFRASLQGNEDDELELCLESGDVFVASTGGNRSAFIYAGTDPFQVIADAMQAVETHMQTFRRREEKKMPELLNWFGWCTWDAFYTDVTPEGVKQGLKSLEEGGTPARLIIVDDGWQSVAADDEEQLKGEATTGTQFARRLTDIKANHKFREDKTASSFDLKHTIDYIKEQHSVKYVYVWHALVGYWGGVRPNGPQTLKYESSTVYPKHSPGVLGNQPNMSVDSLTVNGVGLIHPKKIFQFYNELHSYLAAAGVDGVKVDVQNILETLGSGFGGRVSLTRQYHQALEASISSNFPDNGCIACMSHNTDGLYSIKQTAVVRASDDFFPRDPASHTVHIISVAYNSIFLGEFMQPDWDMFQSLHPAAEYHAAARAVGGCPVYVSDKPGNHDFSLLKRLVLSDGSILRAQLPGRPTRDSLFVDPARDGKSLLKIWNMNEHTGVLGVFNCQGAGWCNVERHNVIHDSSPPPVTGTVRGQDIEWLDKISPKEWDGACAIFSHKGGELVCLPKSAALPITLKALECEVFTIAPITKLGFGVAFAPIGLLKMFNSGGAVASWSYQLCASDVVDMVEEVPTDSVVYARHKAERETTGPPVATINIKVRGCGVCGVYLSVRPKECSLDSLKTDFTYDQHTQLLSFILPNSTNCTQDVVLAV